MNLGNKFVYAVVLGMLSWISSVQASFEEKPLVIVVTSYNNEMWLEKNIRSIVSQDYSNYRIIYVDDCSLDGTADLVESLVERLDFSSRFTLVRNQKRQGTMANQYHAIQGCQDEEIIVIVDGDDWLPDSSVLQKINAAYSTSDIWLTHGTLIEYPSGALGWSIPIPSEIVNANAFRRYRCPSHLRTFYTWLFKKINVQDLMFRGKFLPMTGDQAMMFPMIEMAGDRHAFISDVVYVYNIKNPINDNKVNPKLQNKLEAYIRAKPPYKVLEK